MLHEKVIFYDGLCNLCDFFVRNIIRFNSKKNLKFASLQSNYSKEVLGNEIFISNSLKTVIYKRGNEIFTKSDAIFEVSKELDFPIKLLKYFSFLPRIFTNKIYEIIANSRYKMFGKKEVCKIPDGFDKSVFIDV